MHKRSRSFVQACPIAPARQAVSACQAPVVAIDRITTWKMLGMDLQSPNASIECKSWSERQHSHRPDLEFPSPVSRKSLCVMCRFPTRKFIRSDPVCRFCEMDSRGYQISDQTPIFINTDIYPVLANHNMYVDYPLGNGFVKFVCRTCELSDDEFSNFLPSEAVYSRAPFLPLKHRLKLYRSIRGRIDSNLSDTYLLESYLATILGVRDILQLRQTHSSMVNKHRDIGREALWLDFAKMCVQHTAGVRYQEDTRDANTSIKWNGRDGRTVRTIRQKVDS